MEIKKVRTFGELVNDTFSFVSQNFVGLFKPILLYASPFALLSAFFYSKIELSVLTKQEYGDPTVNMLAYIATLLIANILLVGIVYGYVYFYVKQGKDNFTMEDVWKYTTYNLEKIFRTLMLIIFFMIIGILFFLIPSIFLKSTVLIVIPILFLAITFLFIFAIMLYENVDYHLATLRCLMMIKGRWWNTFFKILVFNLLVIIFILIIKIPEFVYIFMFNAELHKSIASLPLQYSIAATLGQYLVFFLQVFSQIIIILLYFSINEAYFKKDTTTTEPIV